MSTTHFHIVKKICIETFLMQIPLTNWLFTTGRTVWRIDLKQISTETCEIDDSEKFIIWCFSSTGWVISWNILIITLICTTYDMHRKKSKIIQKLN